MVRRCCANCRWYEYEAGTCYNGFSKKWMDFTDEEDCCPEFQPDSMNAEEG